LSALFEGVAALEEVQARRVPGDADLAHEGFDASLAAVREATAYHGVRKVDDDLFH
jgi:hypothetical protein